MRLPSAAFSATMRRVLPLLLVAACRTSSPETTPPVPSAWVTATADAAPIDERLEVLDRWNDAMRVHDIAALTALYDERVAFYGLPLTRVATMDRLAGLFRTTPDYGQTVAHATVETSDASDLVRISFTKNTNAHGELGAYSAYIVIRRVGAKYRIVEESDAATDATMGAWNRDRYPDACRRAIGAVLDELWASRIGPTSFQADGWYTLDGVHQSVARYQMPAQPGGFAHRMLTLEVDLATGAMNETGGWASNGFAAPLPLTMAPEVHARIVEACRGASVLSPR